ALPDAAGRTAGGEQSDDSEEVHAAFTSRSEGAPNMRRLTGGPVVGSSENRAPGRVRLVRRFFARAGGSAELPPPGWSSFRQAVHRSAGPGPRPATTVWQSKTKPPTQSWSTWTLATTPSSWDGSDRRRDGPYRCGGRICRIGSRM